MSVIQLEQKTISKIKNINTFNAVQALQTFISIRPLGSKDRDVMRQDLECFQSILTKLQEKDYDTLLATLRQQQMQLVIDYLHRFMQYVGESQNQMISSGTMLRLYQKIIKHYGPSIIVKANFRQDTLVPKISNY